VEALKGERTMNTLLRAMLTAFTVFVLLRASAPAQEGPPAVDFRYAPLTHLTAICLPADWQKTVITERGSLGYDFGPGPYTRPLTEIALGAKEVSLSPGEPSIRDPRVPVARLRLNGDGAGATLEEFALDGKAAGAPSTTFLAGSIRREGGLTGAAGWADPPPGCDPAFRNVAWGTNRPVLYRVRVAPGSARRIALGFCEPYKGTRGQRVLELRVEGAAPLTIDALKDNEKNRPYVYFLDGRDVNGDGEITVEVHASPLGVDPNVILNAFWVFPAGTSITEEEVIRGEGTRRAEISWSCGLENETGAAFTRVDGIRAAFTGKPVSPIVVVRTGRTVSFHDGILGNPGHPWVAARPRFTRATREGNTWKLELPFGTRRADVYVLHGGDPRGAAAQLSNLDEALKETERYWKTEAGLPFGRITVPDSGIQYVLDASIRDFYQIAERVDGGFQFQPGPSVYRGLWIHDASWDVQAALALSDTASARMCVESMLRFQRPDGRIFLSEPFPMMRETPLTLYALCRYASVTGDSAWLKSKLKSLNAGVGWIRRTRALTLADPSSATYGLFPPGFTDGGIGGMSAEYGTTFWALNALKSGADAAAALGLKDSARSWATLFLDLMESFRKASARDERRDSSGNLYLPMRVGDTSHAILPQQANWGILDGQAFGHLFPYADPLLNGTLAMLDSRMTEGVHLDVGWLKGGVWPFFTAQEGIVHVYQRNYARAEANLYAVANHATPLGTWLEEQLPRSAGVRTSGDASDATAGALFILLLRDMIVNERTDTLEILGGVPLAWYRSGARLTLNGVLTDFGPLTLAVKVSPGGEMCTLEASPLSRGKGASVRIVLAGLKSAGFTRPDGRELPGAIDVPADRAIRMSFAAAHR
jgi:hypothetical protein